MVKSRGKLNISFSHSEEAIYLGNVAYQALAKLQWCSSETLPFLEFCFRQRSASRSLDESVGELVFLGVQHHEKTVILCPRPRCGGYFNIHLCCSKCLFSDDISLLEAFRCG